MNTKAFLGAFIALALTAGVTANSASALGLNASADADVRVENQGLRGKLQSFFSHNNEKGHDDRRSEERTRNTDERPERRLDDRIGLTFGIGVVTDIDGDTITATSKTDANVTWTINTDSETNFAFRGDNDLEVGDRIAVAGSVTDNDGAERVIDASYVLAADADLAHAKGTVTGVDADAQTVTVATKHQGDVTVAVDSSTDITTQDGDAGIFSDLVVGAKVRVQGAWNSLRDIVNAAKIKIAASTELNK